MPITVTLTPDPVALHASTHLVHLTKLNAAANIPIGNAIRILNILFTPCYFIDSHIALQKITPENSAVQQQQSSAPIRMPVAMVSSVPLEVVNNNIHSI